MNLFIETHNLRVAKYLNANCVLVTDIERGGVFAQIIGNFELMKPEEKNSLKESL